ncbi:ferredoxin [Amycolatopsis sp. NPDC051758]|uniref:ferredoxin n=1 Tax=Amycolatopsis sp. NPDC051758 TaxID=3363935 RepID=UPI0037A15596
MRIEADLDKCIGAGMCESLSPDFFEVGDEGLVVLLEEQPGEDRRQEVGSAVSSCPVLALKLRD